MWFLSDGGTRQYGPYSTESILEQIKSGRFTGGFVGAQGEQNWTPVNLHPVFAPALAAAACVPRSSRPKVPHNLLGGLLLVAVGLMSVVVLMVLLGSSDGHLAHLVPDDTEIYLEAPDIDQTLSALGEIGFVDEERLEPERAAEALCELLHDELEMDDAVTRAAIEDLEALAFASRGVGQDEDLDTAVLVRFRDGDNVEQLLESEHLDARGRIGQTGRRFDLEPEGRGNSLAPASGRSALQKLLTKVARKGRDGGSILVWFEDHHLLVFGTRAYVRDIAGVVDDGQPSFAETASWQAALRHSDADQVMALHPGVLGLKNFEGLPLAEARDLELDGPITGSLELDEPGTIITYRGSLKGRDLEMLDALEPTTLELASRLPRTTAAYATFSPSGEIIDQRGAERIAASIIDSFGGSESDRHFLEKPLASGLVTAGGAIRGERLVALLCSDDLRLTPGQSLLDSMEHVALGVVVRFDRDDFDPQALFRLATRARGVKNAELSDWYRISVEEEDVLVKSVDARLPSLRASVIDDDILVIAVGGEAMLGQLVEAIAGDDQGLGHDPAHQRAFEAIGEDARVYAWADVGRLDRILPSRDTVAFFPASDLAEELGFSMRALEFDGDDRMTFAVASSFDTDEDQLELELRVLNGDMMIGGGPAYFIALWSHLEQSWAPTLMDITRLSGRDPTPRASRSLSFW